MNTVTEEVLNEIADDNKPSRPVRVQFPFKIKQVSATAIEVFWAGNGRPILNHDVILELCDGISNHKFNELCDLVTRFAIMETIRTSAKME